MARQTEITLVSVIFKPSERGYPIADRKESLVFTLTQSATRTETYSAAAAGKRVDEEFVIWEADWIDASIKTDKDKTVYPSALICGAEEYDIGRTYTKDGVRRHIYASRKD